jgi:hypothetical protein
MTNPDLYRMINDEPMLSAAGMALLMGLTPEQVRTEIDRQTAGATSGTFYPPADWIRAGVRRRKECAAALGHEPTLLESLDYWAAVDGIGQ